MVVIWACAAAVAAAAIIAARSDPPVAEDKTPVGITDVAKFEIEDGPEMAFILLGIRMDGKPPGMDSSLLTSALRPDGPETAPAPVIGGAWRLCAISKRYVVTYLMQDLPQGSPEKSLAAVRPHLDTWLGKEHPGPGP